TPPEPPTDGALNMLADRNAPPASRDSRGPCYGDRAPRCQPEKRAFARPWLDGRRLARIIVAPNCQSRAGVTRTFDHARTPEAPPPLPPRIRRSAPTCRHAASIARSIARRQIPRRHAQRGRPGESLWLAHREGGAGKSEPPHHQAWHH